MIQFTSQSAIKAALVSFCQRWKIVELAVFGSALREDFVQESDVDLLATFATDAAWSVLDHMQMELELVQLFQREVDLIDRRSLEAHGRPRHQAAIVNSARILYSSQESSRVAG